ncbi:MAG: hypothetical protein JW754_05315 [Candidatus Aenigmarchaeota archaeon]|nr:hypothetical protein [Candidatus Aenigmarchaeota archaeon]
MEKAILVFIFAFLLILLANTSCAEEIIFVRDAAGKLSQSQVSELEKTLKNFHEDYGYHVHLYISGRTYESEQKFREFGEFAFEYDGLKNNIPAGGKNYNILVLYSENVGGRPVIYYVYDKSTGCDIFSSYIDNYIQGSGSLSANIQSSDFKNIVNNAIKTIQTIIKTAGYECRVNLCDDINNGMDPRYPNYECGIVGGSSVYRCYSNTGDMIYCYHGETYSPPVNNEVPPPETGTNNPGNDDFTTNAGSYYTAENSRNMYKYTDKTVFIVSDEKWEDVISLLPLTIWKRGNEKCNSVYYGSEKCAYPLLIYHKEIAGQDADSILDFLDQYGADYVRVVGFVPDYFKREILKRVNKGSYLDTNNYLSFWYTRNKIVLTERDYKTAMLAAVLASRENAPLVFTDDPNVYKIITYADVIVVGKNHGLDREKFIESKAKVLAYYTFEQLRDKMISETDKIILLNPNDINNEYCENLRFDPEHSPKISNIYCHDSLAAPYLAVAKDEAIAFTEVEAFSYGIDERKIDIFNYNNPDKLCNTRNNELDKKLDENAYQVKYDLKKQANNFNYLTVISSPRGIPLSKKSMCHPSQGDIYDVRISFDKLFVDKNNDWIEENPVGRIFGVTVSDTSSYIARDVFYKKIQAYVPANMVFIAHSLFSDQKNVPVITYNAIKAGYNAECYISDYGYNADNVCLIGVKPDPYVYASKNFITFDDHGDTDQWCLTLNVNELRNIPKLDLPFVFANACQTLNYYQSYGGNLIGVNFLRKGALAYIGGLGVVYSSIYPPLTIKHLKIMMEDDFSIGESFYVNNNEINDNYLSVYSTDPSKQYIILGDPTIIIDKIQSFDIVKPYGRTLA